MRWGDFRRSDNIEDRTAEDGGGGVSGGGFPIGGGSIRLGGGALVVIVIASLIFGVNPLDMIGALETGGPSVPPQTHPTPSPPPPGYGPQRTQSHSPPRATGQPSQAKDFVARTLGDTEDVWASVFKTMGAQYEAPRLVLFHGATRSACGGAQAAVGPHYCSADRKLYLDTNFFDELSRRFGAPGDFAQAYVIAHEVGHHVQNTSGTMRKVDDQMRRTDARGRNALSVRLELQADCYAGVWGYFAQKRGKLEPGDLEEGFRAASAVGDDSIQKRAQGYVVPESFTHGSAEQRLRWFRTGLETGDVRRCNTFAS
jgi:predicted metalloprotease